MKGVIPQRPRGLAIGPGNRHFTVVIAVMRVIRDIGDAQIELAQSDVAHQRHHIRLRQPRLVQPDHADQILIGNRSGPANFPRIQGPGIRRGKIVRPNLALQRGRTARLHEGVLRALQDILRVDEMILMNHCGGGREEKTGIVNNHQDKGDKSVRLSQGSSVMGRHDGWYSGTVNVEIRHFYEYPQRHTVVYQNIISQKEWGGGGRGGKERQILNDSYYRLEHHGGM